MSIKVYSLLIAVLLLLLTGTFIYNKAVVPTVKINGHTFSLILAKDEKDKQIGLSEHKKLEKNSGMLFIFEEPGIYPFWMKDMKFPIDIIFISGNRIVTIYAKVPVPKEENNLIIYSPTEPVDRVLEVNSQTSTKYNLKVGDTAEFKNVK